MSDLEDLLARLERDESIDLQAVADALARRWPSGVVVAVLQRDAETDTTEMHYGWRGGFYVNLGMVERLKRILLQDRVDEED